jgi:glycosyltransferase involved in cell wall biosynthesis
MIRRGHQVRLLTSTPEGLTRRATVDGMPVRYVRLPQAAPLARRGLSDVAAFTGVALPAVLGARGVDLVHAWHYGDGWAAVQAKRVHPRRPVVLKLTGTVVPDRMEHVRIDRKLFREAIAGADEVWCNSRYALDVMAPFGVSMQIVPAGVDLDRFQPSVARSDHPIVLCTSAPDDPRKRLVDVADAWPAVLDAVPDARLVVAGRASDDTRRSLLARLPSGAAGTVELVGDLADAALSDAYATAHAVVAPALHEALGLTTLEALASGTPVAGARSGATEELVVDGTGALFEPADAAACAAAMVEALSLAGQPATVERCRAAALPYGWDAVTDEVDRRWAALRA